MRLPNLLRRCVVVTLLAACTRATDETAEAEGAQTLDPQKIAEWRKQPGLLAYTSHSETQAQSCSGVLVSNRPKIIVTAAHCFVRVDASGNWAVWPKAIVFYDTVAPLFVPVHDGVDNPKAGRLFLHPSLVALLEKNAGDADWKYADADFLTPRLRARAEASAGGVDVPDLAVVRLPSEYDSYPFCCQRAQIATSPQLGLDAHIAGFAYQQGDRIVGSYPTILEGSGSPPEPAHVGEAPTSEGDELSEVVPGGLGRRHREANHTVITSWLRVYPTQTTAPATLTTWFRRQQFVFGTGPQGLQTLFHVGMDGSFADMYGTTVATPGGVSGGPAYDNANEVIGVVSGFQPFFAQVEGSGAHTFLASGQELTQVDPDAFRTAVPHRSLFKVVNQIPMEFEAGGVALGLQGVTTAKTPFLLALGPLPVPQAKTSHGTLTPLTNANPPGVDGIRRPTCTWLSCIQTSTSTCVDVAQTSTTAGCDFVGRD